MKNWKINSWRNYPVKHIPEYPDQKDLDEVFSENIWETVLVESTNDDLLPFLLTVPLQKLAYYSALNKGYDIDKPRNLAKSVTVE